MRRLLFFAASVAAIAAVVSPAIAAPQRLAPTKSYVVLYDDATSLASARLAVRAAGGFLVSENRRVGVATATSSSPTFAADLLRQGAVAGVARNKPVGYNARPAQRRRSTERLTAAERATVRAKKPGATPAPAAEPLGSLQWDMAMIHATADGSYGRAAGDRGVLVGVIDTGIDGTHPDIAPNFDAALSRNFTVDIPLIDGPCADEPDGSCNDPANVDEDGHGTHVAGTIALAAQRLRHRGSRSERHARQHPRRSGLGLLLPAADGRRADVCGRQRHRRRQHELLHRPVALQLRGQPGRLGRPQQQEQRTIIEATNRALRVRARSNGVTLIAAAGQRAHRHRATDVRRHQPGLPAGHRGHRGPSTTRA